MPTAWSKKDERQYAAILRSCPDTDRRRSTKTCKRIAAATVNKQRNREGRTLSGLSDFTIEAKPVPGHARTGGWGPGWARACSNKPFKTRAEAHRRLRSIRVEGAQYRIVEGMSPACSGGDEGFSAVLLGLMGAIGLYVATR